MNPEQVAQYALIDSRALMEVDLDSLLEEISARLFEANTLTRDEVARRLQALLDKYKGREATSLS